MHEARRRKDEVIRVDAPAASWCVSRALIQIKENMRSVKMSVRFRIQRAFLAFLDESALTL